MYSSRIAVFAVLMSVFCACSKPEGEQSTEQAPKGEQSTEQAVEQSTYGTDYMISDRDKPAEPRSIDSWIVVEDHGPYPKPQTVVAMFEVWGDLRVIGFAIWQDSTGLNFKRLQDPKTGWNVTSTLDMTTGAPCLERLLEDCVGLISVLDKLPRTNRVVIDGSTFFIYIRQGDQVRKYRTQYHVMKGTSPGFWEHFIELTGPLWPEY